MSSPAIQGALLAAQTGSLAFAHAGGVVAITAALVGSLVLATSSGTVTTIPAGSVGVFAVATSGGAPLTSWALSNASDLNKCTVALIAPGQFF